MRIEINNLAKVKINSLFLKKITEKFLRANGLEKLDVSIALVDNQEIKRLNRIYRGINRPTDVLSFSGEGDLLGEIVISYEQVAAQAKKSGEKIKDELAYILVHGLLHLLGYNDEEEDDSLAMQKMANNFLNNQFK